MIAITMIVGILLHIRVKEHFAASVPAVVVMMASIIVLLFS